jgi:hypothetical protein
MIPIFSQTLSQVWTLKWTPVLGRHEITIRASIQFPDRLVSAFSADREWVIRKGRAADRFKRIYSWGVSLDAMR